MNNNIISVNKDEITQFVVEGSKLVLKKSAEEELIKLLKLKDLIDKAISEVKEKIVENGKKIFPDFKGVVGNKIKAVYRYYGEKYEVDNPEYLKEVIIKRADVKKIEEYLEKEGKLPEGVKEKEREEKLVITLNEKK